MPRSDAPIPASASALNADQRAAIQNADRSFTDRLLGSPATPNNGKPMNADAEVEQGPGKAKPAARKKKAAAGLTGSRSALFAGAGLIAACWRPLRLPVAAPSAPPTARQAFRARARQSAPDRQQHLPVRAGQRHAGAGDPRSPRARRHPDAVVQGRRGGRSAGHFRPGAFLRAHDVPRHQEGAGRHLLPDHRQEWRRGQRLHHPRLHRLLSSRSPRTGCRWR